MDISEDRKADALILALSGKLDAMTAKTFEEKIIEVINSRAQRLVLDLSQLEYVSSSGLRVFLLAANRLQGTDGKIVFCGLQDHVRPFRARCRMGVPQVTARAGRIGGRPPHGGATRVCDSRLARRQGARHPHPGCDIG